MKAILGLFAVMLAFSGFAHADDSIYNVFNGTHVDKSCQDAIVKAVAERCNDDSLKAEGKDRMNPCQDFASDIAEAGAPHAGDIEIGGYAGDADGYFYVVTIVDAAQCKYKLTAEQ